MTPRAPSFAAPGSLAAAVPEAAMEDEAAAPGALALGRLLPSPPQRLVAWL